ncbi:hypothetical protein PCLA_15r0273 [Pseudomonas citronellolis]|nr:hypothetical protein PCLA_15r0273 [Pseudomonas citronellolis]
MAVRFGNASLSRGKPPRRPVEAWSRAAAPRHPARACADAVK